MKAMLLVRNKDGFYEGAEKGTKLYEANIKRERDFLVPVVADSDETVESVIAELNSGKRRLLKGTEDIGDVEHRKLSKR
jgi:hypothetical protein